MPSIGASIFQPGQSSKPAQGGPSGLSLFADGIRIRLFSATDEARRQAWAKFDDPYLSKYNFTPRGHEANRTTFLRLRDRIRLALVSHTDELIGYVSLRPLKEDPRSAELGICFAANQVGKGYGRETLQLVLPWACERHGFLRIILHVDEVNLRAIRLYQRLGFRKIVEEWKTESNPALEAELLRRGMIPGFRRKESRLEVFSWVMEWKPKKPLNLRF